MLKRTLAVAAGVALSLTAALSQAADTLRVSAIPDEAPTELLRKFKPLGAYLEQQLNMKVEFIPVADYAAVVEALAANRVDMAWLGGFTFVQTRLKTGNAVPLVQRAEDEQFTSKIISADPAVKSLQDLKGKTFAFGSVSSTSGSLMPRFFMLKDGIKPEDFFSRVAYSGAHDATVAWVQAGKVDGGVLNASVWDKLVAAGKVDTLYAVGPLMAHAVAAFGPQGHHFADQASLIAAVLHESAGSSILIKGSRSAAMENVVAALCGKDHGEIH